MLDNLKKGLGSVADKVSDKTADAIREFNDTIPTIRALGLTVTDIALKMGVPPEISARFTGSVAALDQGRIKDLAAKHQGNRTIEVILEALRTTANFKDQLTQVGFRGVNVDVKLGLLPSVDVGLIAEDKPAA
jgi:hypothetical protein